MVSLSGESDPARGSPCASLINGASLRFLQSFCIAVHPLYPFYDLAKIRQSIQSRFAGGVTYNADRLEFAYSTVEQKLDHARDLLVLAMGARIEGGNGDAHLPKPVAETWATLLSKRSKVLLSDLGSSGEDSLLFFLRCLMADTFLITSRR